MSTSHITPVRTYVTIWICLVVFTAVTVLVAAYDFGRLNTPVALGIAVTKATLVILFFMEVKYASRLLWVFADSSFVFLLIMLVLTMNDYLTRSWAQAGY
jgi:cytochrome c oxidase subunit 4